MSDGQQQCFSYDECNYYNWSVCDDLHPNTLYNDVSAGWVLIAAIIVFFMKAGFMLVELSFAHELREQRNVVVIKYIDACASTFAFFLIGFDPIASYSSPQHISLAFFRLTDPVLFFFKFTFASNAATIVGGCLVTSKYKLRLPAAFISAFVISGFVHPVITLLIWSDHCFTLSPYRFCQNTTNSCEFSCLNNGSEVPLNQRMYTLDFAGGGAVHLVGGVAGLMICLLAKFHCWRQERSGYKQMDDKSGNKGHEVMKEEQEEPLARNFLEWMYPANGGSEKVGDAALGVIILWFCWFAFNCGSTNSLESNRIFSNSDHQVPYHAIPSIIAVNMILAAASGGIVAICIAVWAQLYSRTVSVNSNEIANGILASLVAITAGCPFVNYWGACIIGAFAVVLYHLGCYAEYKFGIEDTARVVPVHGVCGLWSVLSVGLLVATDQAVCNLHATFEGLCYCELRLPVLSYWERLLSQIVGAFMMVGITMTISLAVYGALYLLPIQPFVWLFSRVLLLNKKDSPLQFKGNWLLTDPDEDQVRWGAIHTRHYPIINKSRSVSYTPSRRVLFPNVAPLNSDLEENPEMFEADYCLLDAPEASDSVTVGSTMSTNNEVLSGKQPSIVTIESHERLSQPTLSSSSSLSRRSAASTQPPLSQLNSFSEDK